MKEEFIQFAPLFAGLDDDERALLADNFVQNQLAAAGALFKTGDQADGLYLVGKGFVRLVTPSGISLATLGPGSVLGEDSLFRALPYDVGAQAVAALEYWKLADRKLRDLIVQRPALGIKLSANFGSIIAQMQDYLIQQLARTPELNSLPRHTLQAVADLLQPRRLAANQYLFRVGDAPAGLFLLENGAIDLLPEGDERQTLRSGSLLGAVPLLTSKPSTANAVAVEETTLWMLTAEDFQALNSRQPGLRRSLGRAVRSRLSRADQLLAMQRLGKMPIFAELPPQTLQAIAQRMVLQHMPAGERVYRLGEVGDAMYLIESGEIELSAENPAGVLEEIGRISGDGYFGEMSLVTGQIRTEDATATRNTNLWILYKADLDALATQQPAIGKALSQSVATRLSSGGDYDTARFHQFALFAELGAVELRQVATLLHPTRYRAGEQIYRANTPADRLYLLERGQVRLVSMSGGGWVAGPGESFGERALLTNQPHNTTAVAETDLDVWTISKPDFDMLMNRYPSLAINMSRLLSQRLADATGQHLAVPAAPVNIPPEPAPVASASRRRQAAAEPEAPRQRQGFGAWYGGLTPFGKIRFVLLILLLILLLGCTVPFTIYTIINGPAAAGRAVVSSLNRALSAIDARGSYEVAAADRSLAASLMAADAAVPPTATYTPFPTDTPTPAPTLLPTDTPTPVPTAVAQEVFAAEPVYAEAAAPAEAPTETPTSAPAAPPAPSRNLDPRLSQLGITIDDAPASPGQQYWRLVEGRWEDEQEAGGKHHIYVDVIDENGMRVVGQPVTVFWGDGTATIPLEDKPAPDYGFNYQMYASGYAYNVKVEGLPSDIIHGAGMGDLANRFKGIHVAYYFVFQRATR